MKRVLLFIIILVSVKTEAQFMTNFLPRDSTFYYTSRVAETFGWRKVEPIFKLTRLPGRGDSVFARQGGQWIFQYKDSTGGGGSGWNINGNAGLNYGDYIGTNDNRSFWWKTNNIYRGVFDSLGRVGINLPFGQRPLSTLFLQTTTGADTILMAYNSASTIYPFIVKGNGDIFATGYKIYDPGNSVLHADKGDFDGNVRVPVINSDPGGGTPLKLNPGATSFVGINLNSGIDSGFTNGLGAWFKRGIRANNLPTSAQARVVMIGTDGTLYSVDTNLVFTSGSVLPTLQEVLATQSNNATITANTNITGNNTNSISLTGSNVYFKAGGGSGNEINMNTSGNMSVTSNNGSLSFTSVSDIFFNSTALTKSLIIGSGERLRLGSNAGTLASPTNGDMFYNSTTNKFMAYENGAWVNMINAGGSSSLSGLSDVSLTSLATNDFLKYNGTSWINRTPANVRTDLGGTTVGINLFTATNPSAIRFIRTDASNNILFEDAPTFRGSIGAGTGNGTVTTVNGTTNRITSTGGVTPGIDISATFENLLSKIANRIDQNNANTTSTQFLSVISDESGTGNILTTNGSAASLNGFPIFNQNTTGQSGSVANVLSINAELSSIGATTFNGANARTIAIQNNAVTNAMLSQIATQTLNGRNTAGTGNIENITIGTALDWIGATQGQILYRGAGGWTILAPGTSGQFLQTGGAAANPSWATLAGGGNVSSSGTPVAGQAAEWVSSSAIQGISISGTGSYVKSTGATLNSPLLTVTSPAAPAATNIVIYGGNDGAQDGLAFKNSSGQEYLMQDALYNGRKKGWFGTYTTTVNLEAAAVALTATGTATAAAFALTNDHTKAAGVEHLVTVAATTAVAGFREAANSFWLGNAAGDGGFSYHCTFGPATGVATTTHRMFVGMTTSTAAPTDVEPSSLLNMFGVGYDAADANLQFMRNDGTGTATKTDLGANFVVPTTDRTALYRLDMYAAPNSTTLNYRVTNLTTGNSSTGTITTTDLPAVNTAMSARGYMSVGGTSSVIGIALKNLYISSIK